ncbi:MAG: hypothetical protein ABIQ44_12685 [Chloroflexia bacterium]
MRTPAFLLLISVNAVAGETHCAPAETVAFSCALSAGKVVSICLTKPPAAKALSYRFGRLGAPELVFPESPSGSLAQFRYAHYFRYQVDRTELSFSNAGAEYSVFDYYEREEKQEYSRGIRVKVSGKEHELLCKGKVVSNLGTLETAVPCDAENALASCK